MYNCLCSGVVWDDDERKGEREKVKSGAGSLPKSTKGAARLNVPIRWTNRYRQYYMPSQHTYCGRAWNLIQACDVQSSIRKCTSPPLLAPRLKIYYPAGDRSPNHGPAETEADMLPSEPARRAQNVMLIVILMSIKEDNVNTVVIYNFKIIIVLTNIRQYTRIIQYEIRHVPKYTVLDFAQPACACLCVLLHHDN